MPCILTNWIKNRGVNTESEQKWKDRETGINQNLGEVLKFTEV